MGPSCSKRLLGLASLLLASILLATGSAQAKSGELDPGFGTGGKVITPFGPGDNEALDVALQRDGKIIAAGYAWNGKDYDFALARYNRSGSLDTRFGVGGKVVTQRTGDQWISAVAVEPDGKIVAAGRGTRASVPAFEVARYNPNGSLDPTFGTGGVVVTEVGPSSRADEMVLQPDGKIVAAGFTYKGGDANFALVRYTPSGALDAGFAAGGKLITPTPSSSDFVRGLVVQSDGRLVAAGVSYSAAGTRIVLMRYSPAGSPDPSFGVAGRVVTALGTASYGYALAQQADGKLIVGGSVRVGYGSDYRFALVRYSATGSLDPSFGSAGIVMSSIGTYAAADALAVQPNGKIVAGGWSSPGPKKYVFALARYRPNGSLDPSFAGGKVTTAFSGHDDYAYGLAVQTDGGIVAAGATDLTADFSRVAWALARYQGDTHTLTVRVQGNVKLRVKSDPAGISCPPTCTAGFADRSRVLLDAVNPPGETADFWKGACHSPPCFVTMDGDKSVTAIFERCHVPKLKGRTLRRATKTLRKNGCRLGKVKKKRSAKTKKGRVISQKPKAGTNKPYAYRVKVVLSKGRMRRP